MMYSVTFSDKYFKRIGRLPQRQDHKVRTTLGYMSLHDQRPSTSG